jgi:hypothetical protein
MALQAHRIGCIPGKTRSVARDFFNKRIKDYSFERCFGYTTRVLSLKT